VREGGEQEDQQDETVFAAVVGEGDFFEAEGGLSPMSVSEAKSISLQYKFLLFCKLRYQGTRKREWEKEGETNLYRSSAVEITPNATRVCACTCLSNGVSGSLSRKAFTRPAMSWHMGRIVGFGTEPAGSGSSLCLSMSLSSGRSGIS